jgi:hypothetical protein
MQDRARRGVKRIRARFAIGVERGAILGEPLQPRACVKVDFNGQRVRLEGPIRAVDLEAVY